MNSIARMMQKLRENLGISFHGPDVDGCTEWLPVRNDDLLNGRAALASKYGVRFIPSDFKNGDILRLKKDKNVLLLRGGACVVDELLFKLHECRQTRDTLHRAADDNKVLVHNNTLIRH